MNTNNDFANDMAGEAPVKRRVLFSQAYRWPWWLMLFIGLWIFVVLQIADNERYSTIYNELQAGIGLTIYLALMSYFIAIIIGLVCGIIRSTPPTPPEPGIGFRRVMKRIGHTALYNFVSFYIEFMRGIPPLVFLLIVGFILVPALRDSINTNLVPNLRVLFNNPDIPDLVWRGRDEGTAIMGLALVYGAFLSEIFRAGIQGVARGQVEAARSLGMSSLQVMRFIVIPQAVRTVLPPLGNDFIAVIKDTSLVTILGTNEITQIARRWSGSTFLYLETYLVLSLIYLTMTVSGSMLVQTLERYLNQHGKH